MTADGDLTLDQLETLVQNKIIRIDNEIKEKRDAKAALQTEIEALIQERADTMRMRPRASRVGQKKKLRVVDTPAPPEPAATD